MIENELKYILRWDDDLECSLKRRYGWCHIDQSYLNGKTRVRRKRSVTSDRYVFTYKQRLPDSRCIEIETEISSAEYHALNEFSTEQLRKHRVTVPDGDVQWDIDFPLWSKGNYFIIAEVEMPENMEKPLRILPELIPYIVFTVPRGDRRFNARHLIDEEHARKLAKELDL